MRLRVVHVFVKMQSFHGQVDALRASNLHHVLHQQLKQHDDNNNSGPDSPLVVEVLPPGYIAAAPQVTGGYGRSAGSPPGGNSASLPPSSAVDSDGPGKMKTVVDDSKGEPQFILAPNLLVFIPAMLFNSPKKIT